jgi:hypothetical protein
MMGARQSPDTGPRPGDFHAFKNGPLVNIDQTARFFNIQASPVQWSD